MIDSEKKQELMQEFGAFIDNCENYGDIITPEQLQRINKSPCLVGRIADVIQNPKKMFATQLKELACCMQLLADEDVDIDDLVVCITEDERLRSHLVTKIHELNNWRDLS